MKRIVVLIALAASSAAQAQTRPSTTALSCKSANAFILSQRAVVMTTGRDLYERFVATQAQCLAGQTAMPAFAPTSDNPQCMVGLRCLDLSREDR